MEIFGSNRRRSFSFLWGPEPLRRKGACIRRLRTWLPLGSTQQGSFPWHREEPGNEVAFPKWRFVAARLLHLPLTNTEEISYSSRYQNSEWNKKVEETCNFLIFDKTPFTTKPRAIDLPSALIQEYCTVVRWSSTEDTLNYIIIIIIIIIHASSEKRRIFRAWAANQSAWKTLFVGVALLNREKVKDPYLFCCVSMHL